MSLKNGHDYSPSGKHDPLTCSACLRCSDETDETERQLALALSMLKRMTAERNEYRTLAGIGTWHADCRPNREMAAREIEKSQAVINKLADRISELEKANDELSKAWHQENDARHDAEEDRDGLLAVCREGIALYESYSLLAQDMRCGSWINAMRFEVAEAEASKRESATSVGAQSLSSCALPADVPAPQEDDLGLLGSTATKGE